MDLLSADKGLLFSSGNRLWCLAITRQLVCRSELHFNMLLIDLNIKGRCPSSLVSRLKVHMISPWSLLRPTRNTWSSPWRNAWAKPLSPSALEFQVFSILDLTTATLNTKSQLGRPVVPLAMWDAIFSVFLLFKMFPNDHQTCAPFIASVTLTLTLGVFHVCSLISRPTVLSEPKQNCSWPSTSWNQTIWCFTLSSCFAFAPCLKPTSMASTGRSTETMAPTTSLRPRSGETMSTPSSWTRRSWRSQVVDASDVL